MSQKFMQYLLCTRQILSKKTNSKRSLDLPEKLSKRQTQVLTPAPLNLRLPTLSGCSVFNILNINSLTCKSFIFHLFYQDFQKNFSQQKRQPNNCIFSLSVNKSSCLQQCLKPSSPDTECYKKALPVAISMLFSGFCQVLGSNLPFLTFMLLSMIKEPFS